MNRSTDRSPASVVGCRSHPGGDGGDRRGRRTATSARRASRRWTVQSRVDEGHELGGRRPPPPAVRAVAGPPLTSRRTSRVPRARHTSATAPGSRDASSTTTTGRSRPSEARQRSSAAAPVPDRHHHGHLRCGAGRRRGGRAGDGPCRRPPGGRPARGSPRPGAPPASRSSSARAPAAVRRDHPTGPAPGQHRAAADTYEGRVEDQAESRRAAPPSASRSQG